MPLADFADFIQSFVGFIVQWLVVPAILIGILVFAWILSSSGENDESIRISRGIALLLGFTIFALAVLLSLSNSPFFPPELVSLPVWAYILFGLIIGLVLMSLIHYFLSTNSSGVALFVTILSSVSLIGLYYYCLVGSSRTPIRVTTMSLLISALGYSVFLPDVIKKIRGDSALHRDAIKRFRGTAFQPSSAYSFPQSSRPQATQKLAEDAPSSPPDSLFDTSPPISPPPTFPASGQYGPYPPYHDS